MARLLCSRRRVRGVLAGALAVLAPLAVAAPAHAGKNDLSLLNLCEQRSPAPGLLNGPVPECTWVKRQAGTGRIQSVSFDAGAEGRFRSLMSELGVVMAPRLSVPADTLGFSGFQVSAEVGTTRISRDEAFWNGVEGVSSQNTSASRPPQWLTTVGVFIRKGIWLPLPAFEVGTGVMHLLESQLVAWQGYAKFALHEGFHDWPIPSFAVRGSVSHLTGTDQARMTIGAVDLLLSKQFGVAGTVRLEPFAGWSSLFIHARSGVIDATPSCDAFATRSAAVGQMLGDYCAEAQRGTGNDLAANFTFPDQDVITRNRFFGGVKVKFAAAFLTAQYELTPGGRSRDEQKPNGAIDSSGTQTGVSLAGGFDF